MGTHTCGIDEVGRGPLAGPVTSAAVILAPDLDRALLADSKALSARARDHAFAAISDSASLVGVGWVWPEEIDTINIHRASLLAMSRAYDDLVATHPRVRQAPTAVIVDGLYCPSLPDHVTCEARVGGDRLIAEIMAASIVAKVSRDRWMVAYDIKDQRYGFASHKGYPTAAHREALKKWGPCPIHRRSFRGVRSAQATD